MKKLIRNITMLVLGLLLTGLPATATTWNADIHAGWLFGSWVPYASSGTGVSAPSGATVAWYAYTYGGSGSWASVSATAPGVYIDETVYDNANDGGSQNMTSSGSVSVFLETVASGSGSTGCGVTVAW